MKEQSDTAMRVQVRMTI